MPIINKKSLRKISDVSRSLDYLGNGQHENHRNYAVEPPRYYGGAANKDEFLTELSRAIAFLNSERKPSNQLRITATWWTLAFPMNSNLSKGELASYECAMLDAIGCSGFAAVSWHENLFNGSADLNIIDTGIDLGGLDGLGGIPSLRRSNTINLLKQVRTQSDSWLRATNTSRTDEGVTPIQAVAKAQVAMLHKSPRADLLRLLRDSCRQQSSAPSVKTLPEILEGEGFTSADWEIDMNNRLLLWRFPGKPRRSKKLPIARIQIDQLIREIIEVVEDHGIALETSDIPNRNTKPPPPAQEDDVSPRLRTTLDVIHDTEKPKNEEIPL